MTRKKTTKAKPQTEQPREPLPVDDSIDLAITLGAFQALREFLEESHKGQISAGNLLSLIHPHICKLEQINENHELLIKQCGGAGLLGEKAGAA